MRYKIETKLVTPIDYKKIEVEGLWGDDRVNGQTITGHNEVLVPVYPEVEIPDEAIHVSVETERVRDKHSGKDVSMRTCRVLYIVPVFPKGARP